MYIVSDNIDNLIRKSCIEIRSLNSHNSLHGTKTISVKASTLVLTNPRARIFLSSIRGMNIFDLVGRLLWELSGDDDLKGIEYYSKGASNFAINGKIKTAYGKRIFSPIKNNQYEQIYKLLKKDPTTRRAVIQILNIKDSVNTKQEYPCIIALHFSIENNKLDLVVYVRSESVYRIAPLDIFMLTFIQELLSIKLGIKLGIYTHLIGDLHIYNKEMDDVIYFCKAPLEDTDHVCMANLTSFDFAYVNYVRETLLTKPLCNIMDYNSGRDMVLLLQNSKDISSQFIFILNIWSHIKTETYDQIHFWCQYLVEPYSTLVRRYLVAKSLEV